MAIDKELNEYLAKTSRSRALHEEATAVMPGGNSRTTTFFDPYPFYVQRGQGAYVWDADGVARLDFNGNYTSLILGHAPPDVVKAAQEAAALGMSFPGPTEHEIRLAEILTRRIPSLQTMRFTNSGTEATMNAVRAARAFTGRPKIAKFEGAYHGTHDWVMVSVSPDLKAAGGRRHPKPVAWSAGLPPAVLKHTVVLPWNDAEACTQIIEKEAANLAAVLVDPLLGIGGILLPADGFLEQLRAVTEQHGIVLIFDEVISLRIAWGGAQERFGIRPDLTTLGKIVGGGLPVGAFGGRADIMAAYDPRRGGARISHGGTFNANPVTMAAGAATLNALTPEAYTRLDALGERLRGGVTRLLTATRRRGQVTGVGSLFCLHWTAGPLTDYRSSRPKDPEAPARVFLGLLNEGILLTQRGLGACSLAMTDEDIDRFINALARVLARE
ncbi:MAG TPA: aspartate aminotransferase family protein [Methylomirabilota bacterium]|jgi:glutamate-1-semialdehyde 2,1-aminomutase|nr:aspartate aminotransferase family protein [Methylomirabilota bacterium]